MEDRRRPRQPPSEIVCIDCGGRAHLLSFLDDEDPPQPGDVMVYRCQECMDRWDVVLEADDLE